MTQSQNKALSLYSDRVFFLLAPGAVCSECIHPTGSGSGGIRVQTPLSASADPGGEFTVQPSRAHGSIALFSCALLAKM